MVENSHGAPPFKVKDCTVIIRMGGVDPAVTLRELRERIRNCAIDSIYHHFCETGMRPTFDDPEFRNDFAVWAVRNLRDRKLAEQLGVLNPYDFQDFEELREHITEIIDDRLSEVDRIPQVPLDEGFQFLRSATTIFATGMEFNTVEEFVEHLPALTHSSIFYHFIDARRRTPEKTDDFSFWLKMMDEPPTALVDALSTVDFYYLNLRELRQELISVTTSALATL